MTLRLGLVLSIYTETELKLKDNASIGECTQFQDGITHQPQGNWLVTVGVAHTWGVMLTLSYMKSATQNTFSD